MKSARINFGIGAESEYVLEVDDTGVAIQCFNPVTGQVLGVGGAGGVLFVEITLDMQNMTATADKNYSEITDAISNGEYVVFHMQNPAAPEGVDADSYAIIVGTMTNNSTNYQVTAVVPDLDNPMSFAFNATSATGTLIANLS